MRVPILTRRREGRQSTQDEAFQKGVELAKSFLTGNAATGIGLGGNIGSSGSWSNLGGTSNQLVARVTQNLASTYNRTPDEVETALAEQGMTWGAPFPPGRPLDPFFGYKRDPRTFDFSVGENVQVTPRHGRVSFDTLKALWDNYDIAQIVTQHLINDVRSLEYAWAPLEGIKEDVSDDIAKARAFFEAPDKRQPFRAWLAEYLQDVLMYDAGALAVRRTEGGEAIALEVVSGRTIIPLIDFYGRVATDENDVDAPAGEMWEGNIVPAYTQVIEGLPWVWMTFDDLIYQPWNPQPDSQYGRAPLEKVLMAANTDLRFQMYFLDFFTAGSLPAGFMEAPPDLSNAAQVQEWQETWDALMIGDQEKLRQIRWVPSGAKFTPAHQDDTFKEEFPLYLMRKTCAAFGVTPADMGFTETVNKSSGDTQIDVQFRVGTLPLATHVQDVINLFVAREFGWRCRFAFDLGREIEDRVATAQADTIYIDHGVIGADEVRARLGYPVDNSRPVPRYVNNARQGPISLLSLMSGSGEVDPETYAPAKSQKLVSTPAAPMAGILPPQGSPEAMAAAAQTAQMGRDLVSATTGKSPAEDSPAPDETTTPKTPGELPDTDKESNGGKIPDPTIPDEAAKGWDWRSMLAQLDALEKAADNTGGPGVHPLGGTSTTVLGGADGINVQTGIQGSDLKDDDDEDDEDDEDEDAAAKEMAVALEMRRWRANSRNRLRKGQQPRVFQSTDLPADLVGDVWQRLQHATTRQEVDAAFADVGKAQAGDKPADFHKHTDHILEHYAPLIAIGLRGLFPKSAITDAIRSARTSGDPKAAAVSSLRVRVGTLDKPAAILRDLYGEGYLQGAHTAGELAGGTSHILTRVEIPADYWDTWKPGYTQAAQKVADGGLARLLDDADTTIQGMTDTMLDRLGNAISQGLAAGASVSTTTNTAASLIADPARAEMIVNTEYCRAMTQASMDTYRQLGVAQKEFLAEGDACPECQENADASPLALGDEWPNGDPPVHPDCRCAVAPVVS